MIAIVPLFLLALAASAHSEEVVLHAGLVAPQVMEITIQDGRVLRSPQEPYVARPGELDGAKEGEHWFVRDGRQGCLTGDRHFVRWGERVEGRLSDVGWMDDAQAWRIVAAGDQRFATGGHPMRVHRKSRPNDCARTGPWAFEPVLRHTIYLVLDAPWLPGVTYTITPGGGLADIPLTPSDRLRSGAIHVNHLGFQPNDPKVAFLSCWLGDGGGWTYQPNSAFVVRSADGREVLRGTAKLSTRAGSAEDERGLNHNRADVWLLDLTEVKTPGTYQIEVPGIGSSLPFRIAEDVWSKAFVHSARGFYHLRSGIALTPPYTEWKRPRSFNPEDGVRVFQSTTPLMDTGNGLNALGNDAGNFGNLVKGGTDQLVPEAWGGYYDAGDWDRRIQHVAISSALLELAMEYKPSTGVNLNIPESKNDLPDVIDEALWNLSFFKRLQGSDGSIRGGVESAEHPRWAEASWNESHRIYAYAPDHWSSWLYTASAARAALALEKLKKGSPAIWRDSAIKAWEWAEKASLADNRPKRHFALRDARNLAAAELFRLTGEDRFHAAFKESTVILNADKLREWDKHDQLEAAWVYARTDRNGMDAALRKRATELLIASAEVARTEQNRNGFRWARADPFAWPGWGLLGGPQAVELLRAWRLTGERSWRDAAVLACQFGLGANPLNMTFTTGLGHDWPRHTFSQDADILGVPAPPGITTYGPCNPDMNKDFWALRDILGPHVHPKYTEWPMAEFYLDVSFNHCHSEYTVDGGMLDTAYVWGMLAFASP